MAKLLWWSNAIWAPTGYGTQSKQVTERLVKDGHEVAFVTNWGLTGAPQINNGMTTYPQGVHPYSLDMADFYQDMEKPDLTIVLYDVWPLMEHPTFMSKYKTVYWCPIDHAPPPPKVVAWTKEHDTIAMSKFGQEQLAASGVQAEYIPHAIDLSVYRPRENDIRERMRVPEDAHLTITTMANIGQTPPRKRWFENLMAWRIFATRHEDAYIYIHTALQHSRGIDLAASIVAWGLPQDRIRIVDQGGYAAGFITQSDVADLYSASDVLLMATAGEGFGLPAIEAQACGIPVIVTDFSAQRELVGAGWKVPYVTDWDYFQMSAHALPDVHAIVDALEKSYEASKDPAATQALSEAALAKAAEYDADKVYAEMWRPYIEKATAAPAERKGMSNAAKRRNRRKAA